MMRLTPPRSLALHRHVLIITSLRILVGVGMLIGLARAVFDPARPVLFSVLIGCAVLYLGTGIFSLTRLYRGYILRKKSDNVRGEES